MSDFLPDTYEVPAKSGNYMKFQPGENTFRVLSSPIIGWVYWVTGVDGTRKPVRKRQDEKIVTAEVEDEEQVKHFWAMPVYNYEEEKIQILELTQATIQREIKSLAKDKDWGSPINYDLKVTKTGKDKLTKYTVNPKPAKPINPEIVKEYQAMKINLEALYSGSDPFAKPTNGKNEEIDMDDVPEFAEQ